LRELNAFNKDCNLLYNPKGYEEKTWILTFISKDIETLIEGNLTLWSDKTITRKHNMKNVAQKTKGIKCYYCPDAKISE
jgi:hypothetical protein